MIQYCRYCAYMVVGDANYCEKHNKCLADNTIKSINHCKDFVFNELDATNLTQKYKCKQLKTASEQMALFNLNREEES